MRRGGPACTPSIRSRSKDRARWPIRSLSMAIVVKGGASEAALLDVVEADHRHVVGNPATRFLQRPHGPERQDIACAQDRVEGVPSGQQCAMRARPYPTVARATRILSHRCWMQAAHACLYAAMHNHPLARVVITLLWWLRPSSGKGNDAARPAVDLRLCR